MPAPAESGGRAFVTAAVHLVGMDHLDPGGAGTVLIVPLPPELWRHVAVGTEIDMTEGPSRVVGMAVVTAVALETDPERHDRQRRR